MPDPARKHRYNQNKLHKRLRRNVGQAIQDYHMVGHGDRIMVCLSGGKDSYTLLDMLTSLQRSAPVDFELVVVNLDQKQPGFPRQVLPDYVRSLGIDFHVIEQDTYSVVKQIIAQGKTMCGLCSRLRRGALYRFARENDIDKIALGHHRDDIVETFFLNLFHGGKLKGMPAKLKSDDSRHVVIRPLAYCRERDIAAYAQTRQFPIIPCKLCGSQPDSERRKVKEMLAEWQRTSPGRIESIARSLKNVIPSHLADPELFDFRGLDSTLAVESGAENGWPVDTKPNSRGVDPTVYETMVS